MEYTRVHSILFDNRFFLPFITLSPQIYFQLSFSLNASMLSSHSCVLNKLPLRLSRINRLSLPSSTSIVYSSPSDCATLKVLDLLLLILMSIQYYFSFALSCVNLVLLFYNCLIPSSTFCSCIRSLFKNTGAVFDVMSFLLEPSMRYDFSQHIGTYHVRDGQD